MRAAAPLVALLLLAGCGGRSSGPTARGGRGTVRVAWPKAARLIPNAASYLLVKAFKGGQEVGRVGIAKPQTVGTLERLPYGDLALTVQAYAETGPGGTPVALGAGGMRVSEDTPGTASIGLESSVKTLALQVPGGVVAAGGSAAVTASAKDADGAIVLLDNGRGGREGLEWSVSPAGLATIEPDGPTAALRGVALGQVTVTARMRVKDDGTAVEATLPVQVVRAAPGLATAGWPIGGGSYGGGGQGRGPAAAGNVVGTLPTTGAERVVGPDGTLYVLANRKLSARGAANWAIDLDDKGHARRLAITQGGLLIVTRESQVEAREAATGDLVWKAPPSTSNKGTAVSRDGRVFVTAYLDGATRLRALDGATGTTLWTVPTGVDADNSPSQLRIGDDGTIYCRAWNRVLAFDPTTGARRWNVQVAPDSDANGLVSDIVVGGDAVYLKAGDSVTIYTGTGKDRRAVGVRTTMTVLALRTADGSVLWSYEFPSAFSAIIPGTTTITPRVGGCVAYRSGRVYVRWNGYLAALGGGQTWRVGGPDAGSASYSTGGDLATARDGTIYSCAQVGNPVLLRAYNPANGAVLWSVAAVSGPLVLADDGTVYASSNDGATIVIR